jgi:hypothetical protein
MQKFCKLAANVLKKHATWSLQTPDTLRPISQRISCAYRLKWTSWSTPVLVICLENYWLKMELCLDMFQSHQAHCKDSRNFIWRGQPSLLRVLETGTRRYRECRWAECGITPCQRFTFFYICSSMFVFKCVLPPGDNPIAVNKYYYYYYYYILSRRHAPLLCDVWRGFRDSEIGVGQIVTTVADWMETGVGVSYGWHGDKDVTTHLNELDIHICTMAAYRAPRETLEGKTILWWTGREAKGQVDRRGDQRWEKHSSDSKIDKLVLDWKIRRQINGARARN